jgi:hypothetical protein
MSLYLERGLLFEKHLTLPELMLYIANISLVFGNNFFTMLQLKNNRVKSATPLQI